ncbi:hypothetical protein L249_2853 [Ophiocordyceps polyrhachis-furcata BCC 54312]|uniref:Uncharacterized protein n=1 Tax=Ophiocordyceps polyrhachis-furcata BCC 54312 TaxID=1330021 RepID=A0A367LSC4_9HYPO|nr:hypothetical protein L249_2853 [Ophiocordyceps polyrhachis-furcata BCC 54312]
MVVQVAKATCPEQLSVAPKSGLTKTWDNSYHHAHVFGAIAIEKDAAKVKTIYKEARPRSCHFMSPSSNSNARSRLFLFRIRQLASKKMQLRLVPIAVVFSIGLDGVAAAPWQLDRRSVDSQRYTNTEAVWTSTREDVMDEGGSKTQTMVRKKKNGRITIWRILRTIPPGQGRDDGGPAPWSLPPWKKPKDPEFGDMIAPHGEGSVGMKTSTVLKSWNLEQQAPGEEDTSDKADFDIQGADLISPHGEGYFGMETYSLSKSVSLDDSGSSTTPLIREEKLKGPKFGIQGGDMVSPHGEGSVGMQYSSLRKPHTHDVSPGGRSLRLTSAPQPRAMTRTIVLAHPRVMFKMTRPTITFRDKERSTSLWICKEQPPKARQKKYARSMNPRLRRTPPSQRLEESHVGVVPVHGALQLVIMRCRKCNNIFRSLKGLRIRPIYGEHVRPLFPCSLIQANQKGQSSARPRRRVGLWFAVGRRHSLVLADTSASLTLTAAIVMGDASTGSEEKPIFRKKYHRVRLIYNQKQAMSHKRQHHPRLSSSFQDGGGVEQFRHITSPEKGRRFGLFTVRNGLCLASAEIFKPFVLRTVQGNQFSPSHSSSSSARNNPSSGHLFTPF